MSLFSLSASGLSPHDALFKSTFSDPQNALVLLKAVAGPAFSDGFDIASLEPEHVSFVDEELEQKHADLLFRAVINGSETFVYLLFEHQSQSSPIMPLRMYRYAGAALQRAYDQRKELPLPALLPIVVHHSSTGWRHGTSLRDVMNVGQHPASLHRYLPQIEFLLDDISGLPDEALLARDGVETRGQVPLALVFMRDGRDAGRLVESLQRFAPLFRAETVSAMFKAQLFAYLLMVSQLPPTEILGTLKEALPGEEEAIVTAAEQLRRDGLEEGRARGREEGRLQEKRSNLRTFLTARFGGLAPDLERRIEESEAVLLDRWMGRVLTAATVHEVFGD